MAIKAKIQFLTGDEKGKVVNVEKLPLLIGRVDGCDIVLAGDHAVSRRHAELREDGGRVLVTDLGSSGGTTVNQKPISGEQVLRPGDVIGIGKYQLRVALPAPKAGAVPAKARAAEEQEGTAFVDMQKLMGAAGEQEGTAFVEMGQFVEGGEAAQDGTAAVDMGKVLQKKSLGERWRALPRPKKLVLGGAGGLLLLVALLAGVAALKPVSKEPVLHKETVSVAVDGTKEFPIPRSREVWSDPKDVVEVWLDEEHDAIAHIQGLQEEETRLFARTWEGEVHMWGVVVEGYEDPYKGLTPQDRLAKGTRVLAEGDEKAKLASGDVEKVWYAYRAYRQAYAYLSGATFAKKELVEEARKKAEDTKATLEEARKRFEGEFTRAKDMEQYDNAIRALETLVRIYPDTDDPKHQKYMYLIRQMKERKAGR